jgi:Putative rhamnosyl transferase
MTFSIDHVLLTRFNLPSISVESIIRAKEGWLQQRMELFERYCLPSVSSQANRDFHWIIYFDPESPEWLKCRIQEHRSLGLYQPFFRSSVSREELCADIRTVVGTPRAELITTNLDNDDGLATDFIDRVQSAGRKGERTALYITQGLIKSENKLYIFKDPHNAFCSVRETWDSPITCWSSWHNLLGENMPVIEIGGEPGWLQVIHGRNVSNRIRGKLVSSSSYIDRFPGLLNGVRNANVHERMRDRLVAQPARLVKEISRKAVKSLAMRLLGREGMSRAKLIWASWRVRNGPQF